MVPREFTCRLFPAAAWARPSIPTQPSPHRMGRERLGNHYAAMSSTKASFQTCRTGITARSSSGRRSRQNTQSLACEQFGSERGRDGGLRAVALEGHFGSLALEAVGQTASIRAASASSFAAGVNGIIDRDAPIALEALGRHWRQWSIYITEQGFFAPERHPSRMSKLLKKALVNENKPCTMEASQLNLRIGPAHARREDRYDPSKPPSRGRDVRG
jgi:hypothetical protein